MDRKTVKRTTTDPTERSKKYDRFNVDKKHTEQRPMDKKRGALCPTMDERRLIMNE